MKILMLIFQDGDLYINNKNIYINDNNSNNN